MKYLTPLVKGLITGLVMVTATLVMLHFDVPAESNIQFLVYAIYAGGIIWTLLAYAKTPEYKGTFGELFGQGFRCFIIVTIVMVSFVGIFSFTHPEIAEEQAVINRQMLKEEKDKTPDEIEKQVQKAKDNFVITSMYSAIFGTMIIGVIFTVAGTALVLIRRK